MLIEPEPGETPLEALLRAQGESEIVHFWNEDAFHPYTEFDREQDRVKYLRLWYARHLAPRV